MGFRRIQFTPDLMPSDITGTDIIEEDPATGRHTLEFLPGPVFTNFLLADEINRTPPKTQAALLAGDAGDARSPSAAQTYPLPRPFFVVATQNPIEKEGTYPLPEAQLDRFMFNLRVAYPSVDEEVRDHQGHDRHARSPRRQPVLGAEEVVRLQELRPRGADRRQRGATTRPGWWPRIAPGLRRASETAQVHRLRGQPAGVAVPGPGGEGPGASWPAGSTSISPT